MHFNILALFLGYNQSASRRKQTSLKYAMADGKHYQEFSVMEPWNELYTYPVPYIHIYMGQDGFISFHVILS